MLHSFNTLSTTGLRRFRMIGTRLSSSAGPLSLDSLKMYMEQAKEVLPASADEITTTRVACALALKDKDNEKALALKDKDAEFALEKQRMETISFQQDAARMQELSLISQR